MWEWYGLFRRSVQLEARRIFEERLDDGYRVEAFLVGLPTADNDAKPFIEPDDIRYHPDEFLGFWSKAEPLQLAHRRWGRNDQPTCEIYFSDFARFESLAMLASLWLGFSTAFPVIQVPFWKPVS